MKTPIKHISKDEKTITHESGFTTVFKKDNTGLCFGCIYYRLTNISCNDIPCTYQKRTGARKDRLTGIFKKK